MSPHSRRKHDVAIDLLPDRVEEGHRSPHLVHPALVILGKTHPEMTMLTEHYNDRSLTLTVQRNGLELLAWRIGVVLLLVLGLSLIGVPTLLFFINRGQMSGQLHLFGLQFQAPEGFRGILLLPLPGILLTTIARSSLISKGVERVIFEQDKAQVQVQGRTWLAMRAWETSYPFAAIAGIRVEDSPVEDREEAVMVYLVLKSGQEVLLTIAHRSQGEQLVRKVTWMLQTTAATAQ